MLYLYKKEERENVIKETHHLIYLWGKVNQTRMRKDFSSYIDRQTTNKYLVRASLIHENTNCVHCTVYIPEFLGM